MSSPLKLTIPEYDRMIACGAFVELNRRIELVFGELQEIPAASVQHDDMLAYLSHWSSIHTVTWQVGVRVMQVLELPRSNSVPEPDIAWVRTGRYRTRRPLPEDVLLVIEVARGELQNHLAMREPMYAVSRIPEYWIVDLNTHQMYMFSQPKHGKYIRQRVERLGELTTAELPVNAIH